MVTDGGGKSGIARERPDPREERAQLVKAWTDRVLRARQHWTDRAFRRMRRDMAFAAGRQWPVAVDEFTDEQSERYVANITLRHIQSRVAGIYGKNPRVVARRREMLLSSAWDGEPETFTAAVEAVRADPTDQAAQAIIGDALGVIERNRQTDRIARTLELLFEHEISEQPVPFKQQMKNVVRRCLTTGVGYAKIGYQRIMANRPEVDAQIDTITAQLARLERLAADVEDGETPPGSKEIEELRLQLQSLAAQPQVVVREGLTFSFPDSYAIIPDTALRQLRGFVGAAWVAEEYFLTADKIKELYRVDVSSGGARTYVEQPNGEFEALATADGHGEDGRDRPGLHCVWEIYCKDDGLVYVVCDGHADFLSEPAPPDIWLERFWPWFVFVVNEVYDDQAIFPPSDVSLIRAMQMELNRARQGLREHRRASRPKTFVRSGALEQEDREKIAGAQAHEVIEINAMQPGDRIEDILQAHSGPSIDPNLYETGPAYEDYLRVLGQHEATLGGTSGATATETSIAEGARLSHVSSAVDDLDEFLTEIARAGGQILLMEASAERVREVVGPGAVWPDLTRDQIAKEIYLDVEAASTGRPNQAQQVQTAQMVFPMLMQIPGLSPTWLARELLRRMDDRLDLTDAFSPGAPSIMALNHLARMAPPEASAAGRDPADQGAAGALNAPATAPPQPAVGPRLDVVQQARNAGAPVPGF